MGGEDMKWGGTRIHEYNSFSESLELTIPERIRVANGLSLFAYQMHFHLADDGSCIMEGDDKCLDYQACSILQSSIDFAKTAEIALENIRARLEVA